MVYMTLSKCMEELLSSIKGARLISYECGEVFNSAYGNLRINTSKNSVEITNLQKIMPFFDTDEEIAGFECKSVEPTEEFKPYCIEPFYTFEIGKTITGVEIINDMIDVNDGEYEISFDQAIIIRFEKGIIMFSRNVWFSEDIEISKHDDYDSIYPISQVVESWDNYGEYKVNVVRTVRKL